MRRIWEVLGIVLGGLFAAFAGIYISESIAKASIQHDAAVGAITCLGVLVLGAVLVWRFDRPNKTNDNAPLNRVATLREIRRDLQDAEKKIETSIREGRYWPGGRNWRIRRKAWNMHKAQLMHAPGITVALEAIEDAYTQLDKVVTFRSRQITGRTPVQPDDDLDAVLTSVQKAASQVEMKLAAWDAEVAGDARPAPATHLEVRHSNKAPYRMVEPPTARYVYHYIGIANPASAPLAENVRTDLKAIDPQPRDLMFRPYYPFGIPLKDSEEPWKGSVARISPGSEALFRIAQSWRRGGDDMPVAVGIGGRDHWEKPSESKIVIERDERLRLDYEVTSATHAPAHFSLILTIGQDDLMYFEMVRP